MTQFQKGDKVRCVRPNDKLVIDQTYTVVEIIPPGVFSETMLIVDGDAAGYASRFVPADNPPQAVEARCTCVSMQPICEHCRQGILRPTACTPDDQPDAIRDWKARADRKAGRAPVVPTYTPSADLNDAIRRYKNAVAEHQTEGIRKAVDRLNSHEYRLGASRFQP